MDDVPDFNPPDPGDATIEEQLVKAVRDLWSMQVESGPDYIVFTDHRRMNTRVESTESGEFRVTWEDEDGSWVSHARTYDNLREACFHAFQGPH
jgi:hypothetical protein